MLPIASSVKNIPGRMSRADYELLFTASIPGLGFSTYYFETKSNILLYLCPT